MAARTRDVSQVPLEGCPPIFVPAAERQAVLQELLSGIELGAWDRHILDWLASCDTGVVMTLASWLARAFATPASPQPRDDRGDTACRSEA